MKRTNPRIYKVNYINIYADSIYQLLVDNDLTCGVEFKLFLNNPLSLEIITSEPDIDKLTTLMEEVAILVAVTYGRHFHMGYLRRMSVRVPTPDLSDFITMADVMGSEIRKESVIIRDLGLKKFYKEVKGFITEPVFVNDIPRGQW